MSLAAAGPPTGRPADGSLHPENARALLVFHLVVAVVCALGLWSISAPDLLIGAAVAAAALLMVLGLVWVGVAIAMVAARGPGRWRRIRLLAIAPILVATAWALATTLVPLHLRWACSSASFDHAVHSTSPPHAGRVGCYRVIEVEHRGDAVVFFTESADILGDAGFAYLPDGRPDVSGDDSPWVNTSFTAMGGGWYAFADPGND